MKQIVAAEADSRGLQVYFHDGKGFRVEVLPFVPFVLLSAEAAELKNCSIKVLAGEGFFCRQAFFSSFEESVSFDSFSSSGSESEPLSIFSTSFAISLVAYSPPSNSFLPPFGFSFIS
jgi:hypothetical protein